MDRGIELSEEQVKQLLRDSEINKIIDEWHLDRIEVHKKWMEWINKEALDKFSDEELQKRFVEYYESGAGRHPFNQIFRDRIIRDVKKFREMLKFLLDENKDVKERINEILERDGKYKIEGVGKALVTSFLFDSNPEKYCIWNNKLHAGLEQIGWLPEKRGTNGERYLRLSEVVEKLRPLAPEPHNNFTDIDTFIHVIAVEPEGERALKRVLGESIRPIPDKFEIMEKTLQEFLQRNFTKLFQGFTIYEDEESRGIEYPTGVGRIDILAIDEKEKEILVIELKGGIASEDSLKVLSYMQWVEENLAEGKKVSGLIIAKDMDEKLKYALKRISGVKFKRYDLDFKLE